MFDKLHAQRRHDRLFRLHFLMIPAAATVFFAAGFWTSSLLYRQRVYAESTDRFKEFIVTATDLGIIKVDEGKLNEAIIAGSEGPGEDQEASETAAGSQQRQRDCETQPRPSGIP